MCAQPCLTLCNPMDCSLPDSSVRGILQARILEWVATSFSRGPSQPRDWTRVSCVSCIGGRFFIPLEPSGKPQSEDKLKWNSSHVHIVMKSRYSQPSESSGLASEVSAGCVWIVIQGIPNQWIQGACCIWTSNDPKIIHACPFSTIEETDACGHEVMSLMICC